MKVAKLPSANVCQTRRSPWQTLLMLAGTAAIARCLTGPTFGYTLFAIVWAPAAAAVAVVEMRPSNRLIEATIAAGLLVASPFWFDSSWQTAGQATLIVVASSLAVGMSIAALRRIHVPSSAAAVVTATLWLTWVCLPLLRPDLIVKAIGEPFGVSVIAANPVIALNASDKTTADWTHQALAYRVLTKLGQDVAFEWPASSSSYFGPLAVVQIGAAFVLLLLRQEIVPRGTIRPEVDCSHNSQLLLRSKCRRPCVSVEDTA